MLEIKNVSISYFQHNTGNGVVKNFSTTLKEGHFLGIVGKSGCGKTTLLSAIAGLMIQNNKWYHKILGQSSHAYKKNIKVDGEILWRGEDILSKRGYTHYMQQDDLLLPWLKIIDNIILPLKIKKVPKQLAYKKARKLLQDFDLDEYAHYYPSQLSGGMRQRIALLRTCLNLENTSPLILLDEPFARLDAITKEYCMNWARNLLKNINATVVLVSHDLDEILSLSNEIIVMRSEGEEHTTTQRYMKFANVEEKVYDEEDKVREEKKIFLKQHLLAKL